MPRRSIDTEMWSDERFSELTAHAKLVFIRLTTGPDATPCGAIRLAPKRVAVDCEISRAQVESSVAELVKCELVRTYDDGWLWLPGWIKHQVSGPGFIKAVRRSTKGLPPALAKAVGRELDRLFPRTKPVDNSPDGDDLGQGRLENPGQGQDRTATRNTAPSRDARGETPRLTGGETGGQTGVPLREGPEPVPETGTGSGPGLSYGQTDLVYGQDVGINAPSSSSAGPPPALAGSGDDGFADVLNLAMAKSTNAPEPDPARERERRELAAEIERRRLEREQVGA